MNAERRDRVSAVVKTLLILLAIGALYALFIFVTGLYIPCPFHALTGWQCPGCGVAHMCAALLRGDLHGAWHANPFVFVVLPLLLIYLLVRAMRFILTGKKDTKKPEEIGLILVVVAAIVFAIGRNIV